MLSLHDLNLIGGHQEANFFLSMRQPPVTFIPKQESEICATSVGLANQHHNVSQQHSQNHDFQHENKSVKRSQSSNVAAEIITAEEHELSIKNSPAYYLGLLIDNEIITCFLRETNLHLTQNRAIAPITEDEMRCFIAILFLSSYVDVPRRRMLWERTPDAHCPLVASAMQRDRFEAIFTALHAPDNLKDDNERLARLGPFIQLLNRKFLMHMPHDDQHSIAECVVSGLNKHQHNTRTTTKSIKVWCGCTKIGYCVWFEPSILNTSSPNQDRFAQICSGRSAILTYARILQHYRPAPYNLLFETVYAEASLICDLQKMNTRGAGADRDKVGYLINPALGGVDRMDCNIGLYRISFRGKKLYSTLISYALDLAMQNAWQLYKLLGSGKKTSDLLGFRRNIVIYYLQHYARPIPGHKGGRPAKGKPKGKRPPPSDARFDGIRHYVIPQDKQTRCAKCTAKTTTRCQKCDVGVHVKCFVEYHTRPKDT